MYSRKFGQNGLPPDYAGSSFRQPYNPPQMKEELDQVPNEDCAPVGVPRYPTEQLPHSSPRQKFTLKRPVQPKNQEKEKAPSPSPRSGGLSALANRSFTVEDIVLAGLILLLLNSDCDSELLLILGFLLLVGLQ